jgi:hypothetical protein
MKEGGGKDTAVGTRTGSEAAMRAMSVLGNAKSNCHRKTHRVEPDGTGRTERSDSLTSSRTLPGEASGARASEESAKAVVVKTSGETQEERRAEEKKKSGASRTLESTGGQASETNRA